MNYCAACHGENGRKDGPLGEDMKPKPAELVKRLDGHLGGVLSGKCPEVGEVCRPTGINSPINKYGW